MLWGQGAGLASCGHRRSQERGDPKRPQFPQCDKSWAGPSTDGTGTFYLTIHGDRPGLPEFSLGPHILLVPPSSPLGP